MKVARKLLKLKIKMQICIARAFSKLKNLHFSLDNRSKAFGLKIGEFKNVAKRLKITQESYSLSQKLAEIFLFVRVTISSSKTP